VPSSTAVPATRRSRRTAATSRSCPTPPPRMRCPDGGAGRCPATIATSQVYVWDRGWADQRRAVRLISGRGRGPGARRCRRAGDVGGRQDRRVHLARPVARPGRAASAVRTAHCRCTGSIATPTATGSSTNRAPPRPGARVGRRRRACRGGGAGRRRRSSWAPAVNADGSQVAFVTDASQPAPEPARRRR
jgi:hypothetical protein